MRFYALAIGEKNPDFISHSIQEYLSHKHGLPVDWSHCAIEVEGSAFHDGIWDSTGRGFEWCPKGLALEDGKSVVRHRTPLPVKEQQVALGWLLGNRGRAYSNLQYALYLLPMWLQKILASILPKFVRHWFANGRASAVCSESVYYFIRDNCAGAENWPEDGDRVDPYQVIMNAYRLGDI